MTTPRTTPAPAHPGRRTDAGLADALDVLAAAAAQTHDDPRSRAVLAVVVQRLEDAAGAWLGETTGEPLVVLQRRFGRAHAWLAAERAGHVDSDLLHGLARALRPARAETRPPRPAPVRAPVLAGC